MTKLPTQSSCCLDLLLTVTVPNKHLSHLHSEVVWIRGCTQFNKRKLSHCLLFLLLLQLGPSSLHTPTEISWRQMSSKQRGCVWTGQTGWRSARLRGAVSSAASDYMSRSFISLHGLDRIYILAVDKPCEIYDTLIPYCMSICCLWWGLWAKL